MTEDEFVAALSKRSTQDIFNEVCLFLRAQGARSVQVYEITDENDEFQEKTRCVYRGDNGTKCAVGCLIPDNLYDTDMEDVAVDTLDLFDGAPDLTKKLLMALQTAHDQCMPEIAGASLAGWENRMRELATTYKLEMPA